MSVYIYWHQISENWEGGGRSFPHSTAKQQLLKASDWYRGMYKAREGVSRAAEKFALWLRMRRLVVYPPCSYMAFSGGACSNTRERSTLKGLEERGEG